MSVPEVTKAETAIARPVTTGAAAGGSKAYALLDALPKVFRYALLICAVAFVAVYILIALMRIRYPFELEWMEGSLVDEVARLLHGQKLYVSPSVDYVPYLYPPVYFYLSALAAALTGIGFFPLRLVSFIASLGCLACIGLIVRGQTRSWFAGLVAAGLFAATYKLSGLWFDIARVDTTYLACLLAAMYVIKFRPSNAGQIAGGVLLALAFLSKQTALAMAIPVMIYCLVISRRRGLLLAGTVLGVSGAVTLLLNWFHDGWYIYYIFGIASGHPTDPTWYTGFWSGDIATALPIACLCGALYFAIQHARTFKRDGLFYLALAVGFLGGAWAGRINFGGYANVLMPAYAAMAILCGLAVHEAREQLSGIPGHRARTLEVVLYTALLLQFGLLYFPPEEAIPTARDLAVGQQFIQELAAMPGDVYVPFHGYLPVLAGKKSHAHAMATADLVSLGPDSPAKTLLVEDFKKAIAAKKWDAVILDGNGWDWLPGDISATYTQRGPVLRDDGFRQITGMQTRPQEIWVPQE